MPMKPRTVPWLQVDEDKATVGPAELVARRLRVGELVPLDDQVPGRCR
jgi:hypothetical protein